MFFVVVVSTLVQGTTLEWVAERLALVDPRPAMVVAPLEVDALGSLELVEFDVAGDHAIAGAVVRELGLPRTALIAVIARGHETIPPRGSTVIESGDRLFVLAPREREPGGPLSYDTFITDVGALAMGRTTYEWILDHEFAGKNPSDWRWPYDVPCWVFTHRELPVVPDAPITFTSGDVATVHAELLEAAGDRNVWIVGGGDLAGQFADVGLLDEVIVWIACVTLGAGAPLLRSSAR